MSHDAGSTSRKRQRTTAPIDRPAYPRKRAAQACRTCRRRRTKCDNEEPACTSCADLGIQCVYEERDKDRSTFDPASLAILQRLNTLEELLRTSHPDTLGLPQTGVEEPSPSTTLKGPESIVIESNEVPVHCFINIETVLSWPVFQNQCSNNQLDLRFLLLSKNPSLEIIPSSVTPDFEGTGIARLVERFFENVHIYNPVLEVTKVRSYMRDAQFNGLAWDAKSCILLLVCALGAISAVQKDASKASSAFRQSEDFRDAEAFFFAAQKRMGILLCKSGVVQAQCFFLAGVYLMATIRPIEAWQMFVQALACCQAFHTRGTFDNSQSEERQLQEGLYWTCFKSELELRLELNISTNSVWDLSYPEFFPSPPEELKTQSEAVWYFYLAEIALRRLGNRILNHLYHQYRASNISPTDLVYAILEFEQQATAWRSSLPRALKLDTPPEDVSDESEEHASLRFILNGHLLDCYEMMYWPFIVDAIHGRLSDDAESDSFTRKGFLLCVQRIEQNERGFYQRHHGTWLMLRSCTRSALVLIGAMRAGLGDLVPADWKQAVGKVMQMLEYWKDEAKDVPDRIEILQKLMCDM